MSRGGAGVDLWRLDARGVAEQLGSSAERGLSLAEATQRLERRGPNTLAPEPVVPAWRKLAEQFADPLIYLLLAAIAVSLVAWWVEGAEGWPFDAVVIAAIVVANALLGFAQQARAESAVEALARMTAATAAVVRDGEQRRIPSSEIVVGDVMVLAEGDAVGADGRLLTAAALKVSEASLTGESEPVLKDPAPLGRQAALADRVNEVFSGTVVTQGSGRAIVTATGMETEMGQVAGLLHATQEDPTPLQREISRVGRVLGIAVVVIAAIVVATVLLAGEGTGTEEAVTALLLGVSLAVAAVPEGLPAIVSLVLAIGVQRMAEHRAIVKKLSSVETLGSASVICSDKTGTLTKGEMTIGRIVTASGVLEVTGAGYRPDGEVLHAGVPLADASALWREAAVVLSGGSLASNAVLREEDGEWQIQGDPTEAAFLVAERKLGSHLRRSARFRRVGEIPFTSDRKLMSSLEADAHDADAISVVTKGAPDILLDRCTHVLVGAAPVPMDDDARAAVLTAVEEMSEQAYRTLGVAYRPLHTSTRPEAEESLERELIYAGTVGIIDPPRPEAKAAIRDAHAAGIRVLMISGDHPRTAARIAADLGITEAGGPVLSGPEIDRLAEPEFRQVVRDCSVYARVTPHHKLRIVDALQADGAIVAMTGDGVNDAPALKSADIGVAMGVAGTEVTKQAAKMVLADDNFATIVHAVREGRQIFANIRKALRYLLSSNMGEVLTVFLGVVLAASLGLVGADGAVALPLLATQILWINLLTDSGPALALGVDGEADNVMERPPRSLSDRVIDSRMWSSAILVGTVMATVTLLTVDLYLPGGWLAGDRDLDNARTAGFTVLVLAQLFHSFVARSVNRSVFRGLFSNRWLWAAVLLSLLLQVAVVHIGFLGEAFGTTPLALDQWAVCVAMASGILWVTELEKLVARRLESRGPRRRRRSRAPQ